MIIVYLSKLRIMKKLFLVVIMFLLNVFLICESFFLFKFGKSGSYNFLIDFLEGIQLCSIDDCDEEFLIFSK